MEPGVVYEVEYLYYQYNSGNADNGFYRRRREVKTVEEAFAMVARIEASARNEEPSEDEEDIRHDLMPHAGYFEPGEARVLRVQRTLVSELPAEAA